MGILYILIGVLFIKCEFLKFVMNVIGIFVVIVRVYKVMIIDLI